MMVRAIRPSHDMFPYNFSRVSEANGAGRKKEALVIIYSLHVQTDTLDCQFSVSVGVIQLQ